MTIPVSMITQSTLAPSFDQVKLLAKVVELCVAAANPQL